MKRVNMRIKTKLLEEGFTQWELAKMLGVSESHISRMLRDELQEEEQEKIVSIIEKAKTINESEWPVVNTERRISRRRENPFKVNPCPLCGANNELIMIELSDTPGEMGLRCVWCQNLVSIKSESNDILLKDVISKWNHQVD